MIGGTATRRMEEESGQLLQAGGDHLGAEAGETLALLDHDQPPRLAERFEDGLEIEGLQTRGHDQFAANLMVDKGGEHGLFIGGQLGVGAGVAGGTWETRRRFAARRRR